MERSSKSPSDVQSTHSRQVNHQDGLGTGINTND